MEQDSRRGRILAFRNDRLGARLISLINAMRLSEDYDLPLAVHWAKANDIGRVFNDPYAFFEAGFVDRHFIDDEEFREARGKAARIGHLEGSGIERLRETLAEGRDVLSDGAFGILTLAGEDEARNRGRVGEILARFPFSEALRATVAEIDGKVGGGTAYHIRRGDLVSYPRAMHRSWPRKYIPDEIYVLHMEREIASGARPVVFSDDAAAIRRFQARFPELIAAEALFDGSGLSEGQRDMMELYAMSRSAKIIAPAQSAFSSTAADLGGATKVDVREDLSTAEQGDAMERLCARLSSPEGKDLAAEEGDLGQSFLHANEHLIRGGRGQEAIQALSGHVEAGLNISFLYPELLGMQLVAGDCAGAVRTGRLLGERVLYHRTDLATAEALHAVGQFGLGERARATRHLANAFWHEPENGAVRIVLGAALALDLLDPGHFLPVSPAALQLRRRNARQFCVDERFAPMRALRPDAVAELRFVPVLDAMTWDWGMLLRSFSAKLVARHRNRAHYERTFARMEGTPDAQSLEALFAVYCEEEAEAGLARLKGLAEAPGAQAIVCHRFAVALFHMRERRGAVEMAREAAALAPEEPAYRAWLAQLQLRGRQAEAASELFAGVLADGLDLPSIHAGLAQSLAAMGREAEALDAFAAALGRNPGEPGILYERAQYLASLGRRREALADLELLDALEKRSPKVMLRYAECLIGEGRGQEAEAVLRTALELHPDHPVLREKHEALVGSGTERAE